MYHTNNKKFEHMNGTHTVEVEGTDETMSFFDWLMMKIALRDEKKTQKRLRKKIRQAT